MTDHPRPAARLLCLQCLSFRDRDQIAHLNSRPVCLTCVEKMRDLVGTAAFEELKFVFRATGEPAILSAPAAEPAPEKAEHPRRQSDLAAKMTVETQTRFRRCP